MAPRRGSQVSGDYSFITLDIHSRTPGRRYTYVEAKTKELTVEDTGWCNEKDLVSKRIMLVSSDRIPKGNYKTRDWDTREKIFGLGGERV